MRENSILVVRSVVINKKWYKREHIATCNTDLYLNFI